jgi:hypothetical protein
MMGSCGNGPSYEEGFMMAGQRQGRWITFGCYGLPINYTLMWYLSQYRVQLGARHWSQVRPAPRCPQRVVKGMRRAVGGAGGWVGGARANARAR